MRACVSLLVLVLRSRYRYCVFVQFCVLFMIGEMLGPTCGSRAVVVLGLFFSGPVCTELGLSGFRTKLHRAGRCYDFIGSTRMTLAPVPRIQQLSILTLTLRDHILVVSGNLYFEVLIAGWRGSYPLLL